jgi:lysine 2,3-aminomutase
MSKKLKNQPVRLSKRKSSPRFPISAATEAFRKKYFPRASRENWNDWRWQLAHSLRDQASLERLFTLSEGERNFFQQNARPFSVSLTPYYASLPSLSDASDPLRRTILPDGDEKTSRHDECADPLGEEPAMVAKGLVHKYPDRALFLVTNTCSVYCRYCNRARMVNQRECTLSRPDWEEAIAYLRAHKEIRDVLISGGDPLIMSDEKLDWLLKNIRAIPHVEFIRIGTKVPMALPQRITKNLTNILKKYHPLWISLHATHPRELTVESSTALSRLADAGLPIGSQTVLLKGVNDEPAVMKKLMQLMLQNRVTPYALFQQDPIAGSSRFRTSIRKGLEIIASLRGHTSGYAVPDYIIDPAGGGGKVQLTPDPIVGREGDVLLLRNYQGKIYRYHDPLDEENIQ